MAEAKKTNEEKNTKKDKAGGDTYNYNGNGSFPFGGGRDNEIDYHDNVIVNVTGDKIDTKFIEELSKWLKENRKKTGMRQKDVADKSGIDLKYYQKIENKNIAIQPEMTTLNRIAKVFGYEGISLSANGEATAKPSSFKVRSYESPRTL